MRSRCLQQRLGLIETLDLTPAGREAIVLIHGDHGSRIAPTQPFIDGPQLSRRELLMSYSTFYAIRVPGESAGEDFRWHVSYGLGHLRRIRWRRQIWLEIRASAPTAQRLASFLTPPRTLAEGISRCAKPWFRLSALPPCCGFSAQHAYIDPATGSIVLQASDRCCCRGDAVLPHFAVQGESGLARSPAATNARQIYPGSCDGTSVPHRREGVPLSGSAARNFARAEEAGVMRKLVDRGQLVDTDVTEQASKVGIEQADILLRCADPVHFNGVSACTKRPRWRTLTSISSFCPRTSHWSMRLHTTSIDGTQRGAYRSLVSARDEDRAGR